jgi:hypothetical protein
MADSPPDRVLHIDMSSGSTRFEPYPEEWRLLGGRALTAQPSRSMRSTSSSRV